MADDSSIFSESNQQLSVVILQAGKCFKKLKMISTSSKFSNASAMYAPYLRFEALVYELLQSLGMENVQYGGGDPIGGADIIFGPTDSRTVVEVKLYRKTIPARQLFDQAITSAIRVARRIGANRALLIISSRLPSRTDIIASHSTDVTVDIWDLTAILEKAWPFPAIFAALCQELELPPDIARISISGESSTELESAARQPTVLPLSKPKGAELADQLSKVPPGRADAARYEDICTNALKYLFESDLVGWKSQSPADGGLERRDLVCRALPQAEFWRFVSEDLKSRYVVFEFKNYREEITQQEVITTERYLYPTALRKVAFIISPEGCDRNASRVCSGAMREHGKLIVSITSQELSRLLLEKDAGSDPNVYLFGLVDELLLGLTR